MKIVRKLKIIIIFLLLIKIQAQENNIQHFTIDHELSSNVINDISQDKIGYLWIATNNGLLKFDGIKFYEINTLKTNCLTINKNIVYAGLDNGLFVKNNSKELFYDSKKVIKIKVFNNTIIVATEQGIYKLTENYLQPLKINTEIDFSIINDILFTNNFYYVATNKGLWKLNKLNHPNKIDKIITTNISSLIKFNTKIIAASTNDGLYILDKDLKINNIKTSNNSTSVKKIDNEIWLSSSLNGIEIYSLPSFTFKQKINKYNSLKTNAVFTVFNDKQNTKWIASNNGLYQIKKSIQKVYF
ncbi:two-component regulator propeller domain-containing protein [Polaribacter ponticola]|uniref:Two-component regulator propeller domain-containing protein n=1 Tax=Polaribacter ponticola TaxID=2978475 RepID=A0ABT5S728_9FLAO|nr:two-component regulator propeller domain-containing protein [Polaribacter sp. MSW5]MDD7913903.1 two-component regulator propeller domain-containing protein [Polaribacter sp. MSW5]